MLYTAEIIAMDERARTSSIDDVPALQDYMGPFRKQSRAALLYMLFAALVQLVPSVAFGVTPYAVGNIMVFAMLLCFASSHFEAYRLCRAITGKDTSAHLTMTRRSDMEIARSYTYSRSGLVRLIIVTVNGAVYEGFYTPAGDLLLAKVTPTSRAEFINPVRHGHLRFLNRVIRYCEYKHDAHTRWAETLGLRDG